MGSSLFGYDGGQYVREEYMVEQDPQTPRERAVLLLRALIPRWLPIPATGFQRLVWTIWIAIVLGAPL